MGLKPPTPGRARATLYHAIERHIDAADVVLNVPHPCGDRDLARKGASRYGRTSFRLGLASADCQHRATRLRYVKAVGSCGLESDKLIIAWQRAAPNADYFASANEPFSWSSLPVCRAGMRSRKNAIAQQPVPGNRRSGLSGSKRKKARVAQRDRANSSRNETGRRR